MRRTLFITGGSRGIGRAVVLEAARQGWDVAFTYVHRADKAEELTREIEGLGLDVRVRAWQLDVRRTSEVDRVADEVLDHFESVQAVIANAGVSVNGLAYSLSDEDWDLVIDTNLSGSFRVCRAFLPELVASRSGRILLVSSITAGGASGQAAYAASKAGLCGLAATLAKEYGPKGITTNVILPGYFDTDMTKETLASSLAEFAVSYCPLRRLGQLEELAKTICFMISEGAGFINGDTIRVTGGLDWAP